MFEFLRDPHNLPRWAHAFKTVDGERAQLQTPAGVVDVQLHTSVQATAGTVDWRLEFPDGTVGLAQSRVTETSRGTCVYSFVLHAPPVSLEKVEGTLETQRASLRSELLALQRLDRPHRLAYVLGEILELSGREASESLGIAPDLFRKRLQRARAAIVAFTRADCGLVSDAAACRCNRRVPAAVRLGRARADALAFAEKSSSFEEARAVVRRVEAVRWALEVHRSVHPSASTVDFARRLVPTLDQRGP